MFRLKKEIFRAAMLLMLLFALSVPCAAASKTVASETTAEQDGTETVRKLLVNDGKYYSTINGVRQKNTWFEINGAKYYMNYKGLAAIGSCKVDGKYYIFKEDGKLFTPSKTGMKKINGVVYQAKKNGTAAKGWSSDKKYYFDKTGTAVTGIVVVKEKFYSFQKSGKIDSSKSKKLQKAAVYEKNFSELKKLIGKPVSAKYYSGSCYSGPDGKTPGGQDGILKYKGFTVHTYKAPKGQEFFMAVEYVEETSAAEELEDKVDAIIKKKTSAKDSDSEKLEKLFCYMVEGETFGYARNTTYAEDSKKKGWEKTYAANMAKNKKGSCYDFASLYGFLAAKATGYDTRIAVGKTNGFSGNLQSHAWTEVKVDGVWYVCDTNLDKFAASASLKYFMQKRDSSAMKKVYNKYKDVTYVTVKF